VSTPSVPDYIIIYSGVKNFFRPFAKVSIDMVLHQKTIPSPCLEVIGYHQELMLEARLYLVYDDLKQKLNKHEVEAKLSQLIQDAERQGKSIPATTIDTAVMYSLISKYVLAHLTCTTVMDSLDPTDPIGEESFTLGYVALTTDKPMKKLEGHFDPPLPNDVEWNMSCTTNTLTEPPAKSSKGKAQQAPTREYICADLDIENVEITRHNCEDR
jgi:hypothetical protein